MKPIFKYGLVIIVYAILIVIVDSIMGIGIKVQWDKLNEWSPK